MKVLVTGARGFVGSNLCQSLKAIRDGKDRRERYQSLLPLTVWEYDLSSTPEQLDEWCAQADFIFNLAGVNRPENDEEFMKGNFGFASTLLDTLEAHNNACPVMLSSSVQASLEGRYAGSEYGKSKLAGEQLFQEYSQRTGAPVLIYRFPNLYGKWCRPNYNSAVATFCNNIANGLPIQVNDPSVELDLLYIDDLVTEMLDALLGNETRAADGYCYANPVDHASLGRIVELIESFKRAAVSCELPSCSEGSFEKKLYATYESYLEPQNACYALDAKSDNRGSFSEFIRTKDSGQVSINVSKPGMTKGNHWHHTKWEKFLVVSGKALVKTRRVGTDVGGNPYPTNEYLVSDEKLEVIDMVPGHTHSITNVSEDEDLVTVIWANEPFDPDNPDTFYEEV